MIGRRGEGYLVAQTVLTLAVLLAPFLAGRHTSATTVALGGLVCVAGLTVVTLGSVGLGSRNLSPFPQPREEATLVETGIFSLVRHPIYTGFSLFAVGWALLWGSVAALIAALVLLVFFDIKARREERWLEAKFPGYEAYKTRVKKLIPFVY